MERPDYGYEDGLSMTVFHYEKNNSFQQFNIDLSRELIEELPSAGADPARDAEVMRQLDENRFIARFGSVAIEMAAVGDENAEDVHFLHYGWGSNMRNPVVTVSIQSMVAAHPESQVLVMNAPEVGNSSQLPKQLRREIRDGNYKPYGEAVMKAAWQRLEGRRVHMGGHSLGTRVAIAATISAPEKVATLTLNDPPGSTTLMLPEMARAIGAAEPRHASQYLKEGFNRDIFKPSLETLQNIISGMSAHQLFVEPFGLSKASFEKELLEATEQVTGDVRVLLPDMSALNDWQAIADVVQRVRRLSATEAHLEAWVVRRHTHSWLIAAKGLEAMLYSSRRTLPEHANSQEPPVAGII